MNLDDDENFHNEEILNVDLYNLVAPIIAVFFSIRDEPIEYVSAIWQFILSSFNGLC